jgi:hypothetical protein
MTWREDDNRNSSLNGGINGKQNILFNSSHKDTKEHKEHKGSRRYATEIEFEYSQ